MNREWTRIDANDHLLLAFIRSDSTELAEALSDHNFSQLRLLTYSIKRRYRTKLTTISAAALRGRNAKMFADLASFSTPATP